MHFFLRTVSTEERPKRAGHNAVKGKEESKHSHSAYPGLKRLLAAAAAKSLFF
jgi:hypothetical protein